MLYFAMLLSIFKVFLTTHGKKWGCEIHSPMEKQGIPAMNAKMILYIYIKWFLFRKPRIQTGIDFGFIDGRRNFT